MLIEDNDITYDSISKNSNIKIFMWGADNLAFLQLINAATFGITQGPINDMDITADGNLMVTIGNTGVGYAKLSTDPDNKQVLSNIQYLNFTAQLQNYTL